MNKIAHIVVLALALGLLTGCAVLRSARVGVLAGQARAGDGEVPITAATVDFAIFPPDPPEAAAMPDPAEYVLRRQHEQDLAALESERDALAVQLEADRAGGGYVGEWWERDEFLAWLGGTLLALLTLWLGRHKIASGAREIAAGARAVFRRGDGPDDPEG